MTNPNRLDTELAISESVPSTISQQDRGILYTN